MPKGRQFRWIQWNTEKVERHGVTPSEAEAVVRNAGHGWPENVGDGKLLVQGRGQGGRFVQVVYVLDDDGTIFVIHAMPLARRKR